MAGIEISDVPIKIIKINKNNGRKIPVKYENPIDTIIIKNIVSYNLFFTMICSETSGNISAKGIILVLNL